MDINIKPNDIVHAYRFEHPIGYGAYGVVWKAHHQVMDLPVAIKVIDTRDLDPDNLERVKQECRIGGKLSHKTHIVDVRDAFPDNDRFFIVMELMTGGSLESYLRQQSQPDFGLTLIWALDLGAALAEVHALKVIHRDLKPQNILLTGDAQVKLSDFGVAHLRGSRLATTYQPGTPGYKAPEQEENQAIDAGVDVYALCAVLFEIWTGRKYFQYKHAGPAVIREETALLLAENYPDLPPDIQDRLQEAVLAGLRPRTERISLAGLQEALQAIQADWQHGPAGDQVIAAARAQVAEQLKPPAPATVISFLPQRPVAARSHLPGDTALTRWLEDLFGQWYTATNNLVLWFDPQQEWETLLDHFSPNLNLLRFRGSQLEVRYWVEQRPPDRQTVVYLPLKPEEADYLLPYRFTSRIFDRLPYDFLLEQGVPLPKSSPQRAKIKAMLPQLIQEAIGKGPAFWQEITSVEKAQAALIRDFTGRLGQFFDQPVETWANLERAKLADHFQAMTQARFGYTPPTRKSDSAPANLAQSLLAHLSLVELYAQAGGPADFPLRHLLPDPTRFDACRSALTTWRYDSRYQERFVEYARAIENDYPALLEWAQAHATQFNDPLLPGVARAAWTAVATDLINCASFRELLAYLETNRPRIQQVAGNFWSGRGETPGWLALALADQLLTNARKGLDSLGQLNTLADLIRAYTEQWWQIDRLYRQVKSTLETSFPGDKLLAGWVDRSYTQFLTEINQHWSSRLSQQLRWDFPGLLLNQANFWEKAIERHTTLPSRQAIFLIDALRYELGASLRERLQGEYEVSLAAMIASLPSVTPVGMSALLPDATKRRLTWSGQEWVITLPGFAGNLAKKSDRDQWWRMQLAGSSANRAEVEIINLIDLLRPETTIRQEVSWLIVTAGQIDLIGENAGSLSPAILEELVNQVTRGVRQVIQAGFTEIQVVTDHGFLLLDRVADHGKAELPNHDWLKKSSRYALGRALPTTEHLTFSIPGSDDLQGCFPHGVVCFKSPGQYNYVHGGPSLQEVIIPHLVVRPSPLSRPVGVTIEADPETRVAIFKVTLKPVPQGLMSQPREVRLALERIDGSTLHTSTEVVGVDAPVVKNLRITSADKVTFGDTLYVTVYDARTGERLARHAIRCLVSLDL